MPIPAYMWLKDDGGADIKGSVTVQGREGSIEVIGFGHGLSLPVDHSSGRITGTRSHSPMNIGCARPLHRLATQGYGHMLSLR